MSKWKWMFGPVSLLFLAAAPAALADESGGTLSGVRANVVTAVPVAAESKDAEARRIREEAETERLEAEIAAARSHDEGTWRGPYLDQNNRLSP
jgi:hypothetical protein